MAFDDEEVTRAQQAVEEFMDRRRPPAEIRDELDLDYRIDGDDQTVAIFEVRPHWRDPDEEVESPVAKMKYVKTRDIWKLYWVRGDGNWHKYDRAAEVGSLDKALEIVDDDEYHCFWG